MYSIIVALATPAIRMGAVSQENNYQVGAYLAKGFAGQRSDYVGCSSLLDREYGGVDVVMLL